MPTSSACGGNTDACSARNTNFRIDPNSLAPPRAFPDKSPPVSPILARIKALLRDPHTREFFAWCLPALLVGLALRVLLTIHAPWAYFHDDAPDFLATPDRLLNGFEFSIHVKKTFLVPIVFTIPFLLHLPALIVIPLFQHALGLALVVLIGLLCRLWFRAWRLFIVPLTLLTAVNPFFLWYEHTLMAETIYIVCTVLVAVAGTLYALRQSRGRFILLCTALFLEAGARPEGKLLFGFGLFLLALLHWRAWRENIVRFAVMFALAVGTHFATKTSQAGLLLYTSVARLTPTELKCAPGFDPYIAPVREDLQRRWEERPQFPRVRDRRAVADAVERYMEDRDMKGTRHSDVNAFCLKLATETCRRNFSTLPVHTWHKFRFVANEAPSGRLDNAWLFDKQREAYLDALPRNSRLARNLFGREMQTPAEMNAWIDTHYGEVPWLNTLIDRWLAVVNAWRFPDAQYPNEQWPAVPIVYPGVPFYFLVAAAGLIAVALRRGTLQPFHVAWCLTMLAFFYTIMLTANVRPRFRFVFEPFWFLYIALLAESLWLCIRRGSRR